MHYLTDIVEAIWHILLDSSIYIIIGIVLAGFLKIFLNTDTVIKHLGKDRYKSVVKASLFGVPLPL